ncbi:mechanosensitive ion channel family protein [Robertmurraya massiliosenegalensis]|uniref:mechanosensitive ion channel family protein n=1 Tax=Robertmurraya TaxID=2837507 RepID=UPI0039A75886
MRWKQFLEYEFLLDLGISIGIFLLFLIFRKLFAKYVFSLLLKLSKKAPTEFLSRVFLAFEKPIQWLFLIIGVYVAVDIFPYLSVDRGLFPKIIQASIIFFLSWGLYNLSSSSSLVLTKMNKQLNMEIDEILIPFLSKAIRAVIVVISFSIIAQVFDYEISGLVAGLGLGGLAFSLAAKDALANLFGGIVIITEKPFSIGDWIMTPSVEGTVEEITFRSTRVRTFAQAVVTVPNATLANENITNWSEMGKRQITFQLRVMHDTPRENLQSVVNNIEEYLKNHDGVHKETIFVKFDQYSENGLGIFLYFFTNTTVWGEFLTVKEEINFAILEILEREQVMLSIPSRKLYVDSENSSSQNPSLLSKEGSN